MSQMHNPCHPGEVLKEALRQISVTDAAKRHGVGSCLLYTSDACRRAI